MSGNPSGNSLNLSKSKYCSAVQCPKMLWLRKYNPDVFDDSVMNEAVLETGNEVGDLAMELFGDFTEVPYGNLYDMIKITEELVNNGTKVIAEASFTYDGNFCSVDILKNLGNKDVELYEVKSSTSLKDIYIHDVSYQYYVLSKLGYNVKKACLVHINNEYVRHGALDINQLFEIHELTDVVKEKFSEVEQRISDLRKYMEQESEPSDEIGEKCTTPYDCGFWKYCTRDLPHPNIFDVASVQSRTKWKNYRNGIISFEDISNNNALNENCILQVEHELNDIPDKIDVDTIREFMSTLSYPIYFLDFESFNPAIPLYDNSKPFEQIVFQYSLHYIEHEGAELKHKEFLAYPGGDPRRALAEQLCKDIPLDVCTTAYNMTFEKTRIKGLAEIYTDLSEHLLNINENMKDLMVPFQKKHYYTKAMQGSYSIKYVLPALFPNDPSLDYHNLEGVHNGGEASDTFKRMSKMEKEELEKYRGYLLKYCGLDTFAMVKLWEKLCEV